MYGKLKGKKIRRRASLWENALLILLAVLGYMSADVARSSGIPAKWLTAIFGTLLPFGLVIYAYRGRLLRWSLWASLLICLAVHVLAIGVLFQFVLSSFQRFSIFLWIPVMLIEFFVLLIAVKRIEEKFTGQHETIKPRF